VVLERDGQAMGGRAGQSGRVDEVGERAGPGARDGVEHGHGAVEDLDPAW
jgi:hypothetical protein